VVVVEIKEAIRDALKDLIIPEIEAIRVRREEHEGLKEKVMGLEEAVKALQAKVHI